jgi:hypothetical protein
MDSSTLPSVVASANTTLSRAPANNPYPQFIPPSQMMQPSQVMPIGNNRSPLMYPFVNPIDANQKMN